jgi:hypothetical protein
MNNLIDKIGETLDGEPLDEVIPALFTLVMISAQIAGVSQEDMEKMALRFIRGSYEKQRMH